MIYFIRVAALQSNKLAIIRIVKSAADAPALQTLMRHGLTVMAFNEKEYIPFSKYYLHFAFDLIARQNNILLFLSYKSVL